MIALVSFILGAWASWYFLGVDAEMTLGVTIGAIGMMVVSALVHWDDQ